MEMLLRITEENRVFLETVEKQKQKRGFLDQVAALFLENMVTPEGKSVALPYGTIQYIQKKMRHYRKRNSNTLVSNSQPTI